MIALPRQGSLGCPPNCSRCDRPDGGRPKNSGECTHAPRGLRRAALKKRRCAQSSASETSNDHLVVGVVGCIVQQGSLHEGGQEQQQQQQQQPPKPLASQTNLILTSNHNQPTYIIGPSKHNQESLGRNPRSSRGHLVPRQPRSDQRAPTTPHEAGLLASNRAWVPCLLNEKGA